MQVQDPQSETVLRMLGFEQIPAERPVVLVDVGLEVSEHLLREICAPDVGLLNHQVSSPTTIRRYEQIKYPTALLRLRQ